MNFFKDIWRIKDFQKNLKENAQFNKLKSLKVAKSKADAVVCDVVYDGVCDGVGDDVFEGVRDSLCLMICVMVCMVVKVVIR